MAGAGEIDSKGARCKRKSFKLRQGHLINPSRIIGKNRVIGGEKGIGCSEMHEEEALKRKYFTCTRQQAKKIGRKNR